MNERKRILTMLGEGKITAEEAEKLLDALDERRETPADTVVLKDKRGRKPTKLHVKVDAAGESPQKAKVNIGIPISLIKTFGPLIVRNLPKEAKEEMDKNGVDIAKIIADIDELIAEASDEDIVNIDTEGDDAAKVRIYFE